MLSFLYILLTSVKKTYGLKLITTIIRPEKLNILVDVLKDEELVQGMTVTKVKGFGRQRGHSDDDKSKRTAFLPKMQVDIVVNDWDVPKVMEIIKEVMQTGEFGDGKIFVLDAKEALRIRTGEKGVNAM